METPPISRLGELREIPKKSLRQKTREIPGIRGGVITERHRVNQRFLTPLVYMHGDTNVNG